jgi:putative FmdB family regulatory protein
MPIFEYSCTKCGCRFEKLHKTTTEPKPICPDCGSSEARKELSAFSSGGSSASGAGCYSGG